MIKKWLLPILCTLSPALLGASTADATTTAIF